MLRTSQRLVLVLAAGLALTACNKKPKGPQYVTSPAQRGRVVGRVTATGTLSALVTVQVGSQVSGRISELHADYNSSVKKGELLARIDPQLFEAALEQAKANESAAEGNLAKAKAQALDAQRQLVRQKQLADRKLVSPQDLDTAQANADAAEASVRAADGQVAQATAQRHQAQVNLEYTNIISPIDGTVISRSVDVGQTVAASLQAPTLFTIAQDLRQMQVDTNVAEADVGKLQPGMAATFTVDAYPGERFRGVIRQIRNAPTTVQNVVTYDAVIDVKNDDLKLRPGMTANVTFVYAQADDVLVVSNAALRWRPEGASPRGGNGGARGGNGGGHRDAGGPGTAASAGQSTDGGATPAPTRTLYVLRNGQPAQVTVGTGITDGTNTEILSGDLHEGDAVITDSTGGPSAAAQRMSRPF